MLRFILGWFFICANGYLATCQVNSFTWHELGIEDGLSQATNAFVYKDSRGFIWISSIAGLNRYDGTDVKIYMPDENDPATMLGENVQSTFFEDPQGDLWFATYNAINKYNWNTDCFDHYQVIHDTLKGPESGYYIFFLDPQQFLWMLVDGRLLYTFHIPTGTTEYKGEVNANTIRCFPTLDQKGNMKKIMLRGRDWPGIYMVDINPRREMSSPYLLSSSENINVNNIKPMLVEGDRAVWLLSSSSLIHYSFSTGHMKTYPVADGESLVHLNDSILLIGTLNAGLKTFNINRHEFISPPEQASPRSPSGKLQKINYLFRDRDGTIWVSTDGVGVYFAHPGKNKFDFISFSDYLPVTTEIKPVQLYEDQPGRILCFTTTDGVLEISLLDQVVHIKPYEPLEYLNAHRTDNVARDTRGRYWIGTWSGIFVYFPETQDLVRVTDSLTLGLSSQASPYGSVYYTTATTGFCEASIDENNIPAYTVVKQVPEDEAYLPILLDHKNRIWLNHNLKGFKVFDPLNYKLIALVPVHGYCNALESTTDGKTIFVGATTGLFEIDEATFHIRKIHTEQTGLPATAINCILRDDHGHLWMGHSKGIAVFDPQTGNVKAYGKEDGLPATEFIQAKCKLNNGTFCFASIGGIAMFFPDSVKEIRTPAIPQITNLQVNDKAPAFTLVCQNTQVTHFPAIEKLIFSYRYNTLSFNINALEYSAPESNTLRYTMEGIDEEYITAKNGSRIRYPDVPPGAYRFVLYASNSDGIENPVPRILQIEIRAPYYKTWWFMTLSALFIFSIVAYIIYLRFSKKLELQNIRLKLYENLHDDVGSRLTAIVLSVEDLEHNEHISHPKIKAISKIARSIVGNMRRLVWAIDPVNDRMMNIVQKINHDKSLILDDQIDFSLDVDPVLRNVILPGEFRYQICSICNESFNNISKYAAATHVAVKIYRENKHIVVTVEDNGKGFDPEASQKNELTGSGYGLSNMHRRASRIGGTFQIRSMPGKGTKIEFRFPFKG